MNQATKGDRPVILYDTTLRDGTQGENITLSLADKIRVARMLNEYGMPFIEGGWPGSNPKDVEFFAAAKRMTWSRAKLAAFGSTRHRSNRADEDPNLRELVAAETPVVAFRLRAQAVEIGQPRAQLRQQRPGLLAGVMLLKAMAHRQKKPSAMAARQPPRTAVKSHDAGRFTSARCASCDGSSAASCAVCVC